MLAPLFISFAPDMTRKELTDFVGEKVAWEHVSRARRSTKRSEVVRRRPGIVTDAESRAIPDQRCTASRCTASGKRRRM